MQTAEKALAQVVGYSRRYTENPYDRGTTLCLICGKFDWENPDWDRFVCEITLREVQSYEYSDTCEVCSENLWEEEYDPRPDAYEARAAQMEAGEQQF